MWFKIILGWFCSYLINGTRNGRRQIVFSSSYSLSLFFLLFCITIPWSQCNAKKSSRKIKIEHKLNTFHWFSIKLEKTNERVSVHAFSFFFIIFWYIRQKVISYVRRKDAQKELSGTSMLRVELFEHCFWLNLDTKITIYKLERFETLIQYVQDRALMRFKFPMISIAKYPHGKNSLKHAQLC